MGLFGNDLKNCLDNENNGIKKLAEEWSFNKAKIDYQNKLIEYLFDLIQSLDKKYTKIPLSLKSKFINELKDQKGYSLGLLLKVAEIPESTFHDGKKSISYLDQRKDDVQMIKDIYVKHNGHIGAEKIKEEIKKKTGQIINVKKIRTIKERANMNFVPKKSKKYNSYMGDPLKTRTDLLGREFISSRPLEKLATDVMMLKFDWGKAYFQCFYDLFNREILAYDVAIDEDDKHTIDMFLRLKEKYGNKLKGVIIHSDRGHQYLNENYIKLLNETGVKQSFSRVGNCLDNSAYESFNNVFKKQVYLDKEKAITSFTQLFYQLQVEVYLYNNKNIRECLGWKTPIEYKTEWEKKHEENK